MFKITEGKGFHITFENGWTVSVQFGAGNYSDNYDLFLFDVKSVKSLNPEAGANGSTTAEVWAWNKQGHKLTEDPLGYQTPAEVLAVMVRVAAMEA